MLNERHAANSTYTANDNYHPLSRYTRAFYVCRIFKSEFLFVFMATSSSISQRGNAGSMSKQHIKEEWGMKNYLNNFKPSHHHFQCWQMAIGLMITGRLPRFMQRFCLFFIRLYKVIYQTWMRSLKREFKVDIYN